jgi:hypothetical protein
MFRLYFGHHQGYTVNSEVTIWYTPDDDQNTVETYVGWMKVRE